MFRRDLIRSAGAAGILSALGASVRASGDPVLLTVDSKGDGQDIRSFADADLMALPQVEFATSTIWTDTVATYSGPSLASVLDAAGAGAGAGAGRLRMTAVNDYKVDMPRAQVEATVPIIANRINGKPFGIRDKGPLWLMFPFDADLRFQNEEVYSFSIWQLTQIAVLQG